LAAPQVLASLSELAIPHLTSASIFAVTKAGSESLFHHNVRLLCVRPRMMHLCRALAARALLRVMQKSYASYVGAVTQMHACKTSRAVVLSIRQSVWGEETGRRVRAGVCGGLRRDCRHAGVLVQHHQCRPDPGVTGLLQCWCNCLCVCAARARMYCYPLVASAHPTAAHFLIVSAVCVCACMAAMR